LQAQDMQVLQPPNRNPIADQKAQLLEDAQSSVAI